MSIDKRKQLKNLANTSYASLADFTDSKRNPHPNIISNNFTLH